MDYDPPLLLILKDMDWKHTAYHINYSDPGHNCSKQQLDKNLKITFASPSKNVAEKKKENNGNCKAFCIIRKRKKNYKKIQKLSDVFTLMRTYCHTQNNHIYYLFFESLF